ncbi:nuclear transport factor 2 family protein [Nocardioides mangrovi]|uniref:Nuclear transport factor 2 family protein n=1 Tax=Nocardioides mangrovi TaxID=2874580 RepID=A0ABS7UEX2_9ACTN|nr:nuclear transport factor 2 family protein [Nocardioides mangrovi]MBZ5739549.1 nuclear transport factor 2 family protein [Nocardioides mangrovi]
MPEPRPATVLPAEDQLEIGTLVARLCQALDFSRPADFVEVFTDDGIYQAVSSEATGRQPRFRHVGPQELLAFATAAVEKRQGLGRHWTGDLVLESEAAGTDHARGTSYVLFVEIDADTKERRVLISGVHEDRFVRTPDGWRVASRTVVADI